MIKLKDAKSVVHSVFTLDMGLEPTTTRLKAERSTY